MENSIENLRQSSLNDIELIILLHQIVNNNRIGVYFYALRYVGWTYMWFRLEYLTLSPPSTYRLYNPPILLHDYKIQNWINNVKFECETQSKVKKHKIELTDIVNCEKWIIQCKLFLLPSEISHVNHAAK